LHGLLGLGSAGSDDPFLLGAALLDLISIAAAQRPLLVVVDDWHWVDSVSAAALEFAFRRLEHDAVGILTLSRHPPARPLARSRDVVLQLRGLGLDAGVEFLARSGPIAEDVAKRIVVETAGLPLALREVGATLSADQRTGLMPLPNPLPIGERLLAEYGARLSGLPSDVRTAVGVVAVAGSDPRSVSPALSFLGLDTGLVEAAADAVGVFSADRAGALFPHPLMRAAAVTQLSRSERRRVEWALASVVEDPERRAIHLRGSTREPSAEISALLEETAQEVLRRRGPMAAAGVWADAAQISPAGPARIARLLKAGELLTTVGRLSEAQRCLAELLGSTDDPAMRAEAVLLMSWSRWWSEPAEAARDAMEEADRVLDTSPPHAARLRSAAAVCNIVCADLRAALVAIPAVEPPVETDAPPTLEVVAPASVLATAGRVVEANRQLTPDRVRRWTLTARMGPTDLVVIAGLQLAAVALVGCERFDEAKELVDAASNASRRSGHPQGITFMLGVDSLVSWWRSDWDRVNAALVESLTLAADTNQRTLVETAEAMLGRLAAARGDAELVDFYFRERAGAAHRSRSLAHLYRLGALGLWHLGSDRPAQSAAVLAEMDRLTAAAGIANPVFVPYVGDYVSALIGSGNQDLARSVVDRTLEQAECTGLSWPRAVGLRGRAMLDPGGSSDRDFASALEAWPGGFEGARTRLAWAENLLSRDDPGKSQELVDQAAQEFSRLGARPWLERTLALLGTPPTQATEASYGPGIFSVLTAQELKVALKVAEGCTNREAATQLFISAKTVEHHLSAAYIKLGIRSRSELARLAAETDRLRTTWTNRTRFAP